MCRPNSCIGVYDELIAAGARHGLVHAGYHALNSLRIEKAYRHWGHDITDEDTPLGSGPWALRSSSTSRGGFIGREALLRQRSSGVRKRLVQFKLKSPEPLLYHNEPIWRAARIVGFVRSGMYAPFARRGRGARLRDRAAGGGGARRHAAIDADGYEIEVAGIRDARDRLAAPDVRPEERADQMLNTLNAANSIAPLQAPIAAPAAKARTGYRLGSRFLSPGR